MHSPNNHSRNTMVVRFTGLLAFTLPLVGFTQTGLPPQQGLVTYQAPPGAYCPSQQQEDTQYQQHLQVFTQRLNAAQARVDEHKAKGRPTAGWQVQVDQNALSIAAENAYHACKTKSIAQGCPPNVDYQCNLCRQQILIAGNLARGPYGQSGGLQGQTPKMAPVPSSGAASSNGPGGLQPLTGAKLDTSVCDPGYLKGGVQTTGPPPTPPSTTQYRAPQAIPTIPVAPPPTHKIQRRTQTTGPVSGSASKSALCGSAQVTWKDSKGNTAWGPLKVNVTWSPPPTSDSTSQYPEQWYDSSTAGMIDPRTGERYLIQQFQGRLLPGPDGLPRSIRVDNVTDIYGGGPYSIGGVIIPLQPCP